MAMRHQWATAITVSLAAGTYCGIWFVAVDRGHDWSVWPILPGWFVSYILTGGVHSDWFRYIPIFAVIANVAIYFAATLLVFRLIRRLSNSENHHA